VIGGCKQSGPGFAKEKDKWRREVVG